MVKSEKTEKYTKVLTIQRGGRKMGVSKKHQK